MQTDLTRASMSETEAAAHSSIMFSRSAGLLSQSGNADAVLKTLVSDDTADAWRLLARSFGMNSSEFLRIVVMERLYGAEGVARMTREQIELVAGKGPKKVLEGQEQAQ